MIDVFRKLSLIGIFICIVLSCRPLQYKTAPLDSSIEIILSQENNCSDKKENQIHIIRRALQSWLLLMEQSEKHQINNQAFNTNYIPVGVNIKPSSLNGISCDSFSVSGISLYEVDFANAIKISELGESICYRKNTTVGQNTVLHCSFSLENQLLDESVKKTGFIVGENRNSGKLYFLSQDFISYDYSVWQIWHDIYKLDATASILQGDSSFRNCLYTSYFKLILHADYDARDFQIKKLNKEYSTLHFYSAKTERYFMLKFNSDLPYLFKIYKG